MPLYCEAYCKNYSFQVFYTDWGMIYDVELLFNTKNKEIVYKRVVQFEDLLMLSLTQMYEESAVMFRS